MENTQETKILNVYEKLMIVQSTLKAPKSQKNTFGNYFYRSCEDIVEAVKPILKEVKAVLLFTDELVQIGDRYYIKSTAIFKDVESSGEIQVSAFARESVNKKGMDDSQITGSTSSYSRKYAANGLFGIDDTKDADTRDNRETKADTQQVSKNPQETKELIAILSNLLTECKISDDQEKQIRNSKFEGKPLSQMEVEELKRYISMLKAHKARMTNK